MKKNKQFKPLKKAIEQELNHKTPSKSYNFMMEFVRTKLNILTRAQKEKERRHIRTELIMEILDKLPAETLMFGYLAEHTLLSKRGWNLYRNETIKMLSTLLKETKNKL